MSEKEASIVPSQEKVQFQGNAYTSLSQLEAPAEHINPDDLDNAIFVFASTKQALDQGTLPNPLKQAILKAEREGRVSFRTDMEDRFHPYKHVADYLEGRGITIPKKIREQMVVVYERKKFQELLKSVGLNIAFED